MKDTIVGYLGSAFGTILTIVQTNEILQIISAILAVINFLTALAFTVWKWYKSATKEDSDGGKNITTKEVSNLVEQVGEQIEKKGEGDENAN